MGVFIWAFANNVTFFTAFKTEALFFAYVAPLLGVIGSIVTITWFVSVPSIASTSMSSDFLIVEGEDDESD